MNLAEKLAETGRLFPGGEALVHGSQRVSYARLNDQVNRLANGLKKLGLESGHRVLVALENCPEFVISFYAIMAIRGVVVPVDPFYTIYEAAVIARDATPELIICNAQNLSLYRELAGEVSIPRGIVVTGQEINPAADYSFEQILAGSSPAPPPFPAEEKRDTVVEILYTPGNTGKPKGVMLTNHNLYSNATTFARFCHLTPEDRSLLVAPAYHSGAQTCLLHASLAAGATVVILERWPGPRAVLETMEKERITYFFGTPTMYSLLVNYPEAHRYNLDSWRLAYAGGSHLSPQLFYAFSEKFGLTITEGYGLTETSPVVCSNPVDGPKKPGSVGPAFPGVEVQIVDYEDEPVPAGQVGEIIVRGPNVMKGYFNQEEETRWALRNGWLHTGDLAYMDGDGYVFIVDRKKNVIIRGGVNIDPREVEDVLYLHPQVFDVAVVGVPDPVMGEEVMAFVMLRENAEVDAESLKEFCAGRLAPYKVPRRIQFVDDLPKTTSGKLLKRELKRIIDQLYNNNTPS
ncbi:MAG TPA: long-chain fatty acid--CoA ligase [Desulfotomaculum sp.]|nr:long-chain fatty acid--CoA ligase [Desulfotomaculum sp.]